MMTTVARSLVMAVLLALSPAAPTDEPSVVLTTEKKLDKPIEVMMLEEEAAKKKKEEEETVAESSVWNQEWSEDIVENAVMKVLKELETSENAQDSRTLQETRAVDCPDVDPTLTPWNPGHDETAQVVVGQGQHFLLQSSASFHSLEIKNGGRVVFADLGSSSETEIALRSREITVSTDGEFHIGSETCPYQGKATVSLYGRSDDKNNNKQFMVLEGGTLEVHGKRKLGWTQLTQTVPAGGLPKGTYFWDTSPEWPRGIHVRVFDEISGTHVSTDRFDTQISATESLRLAAFIDQLPDGKVVALAVVNTADRRLEDTAKQKIRELGSVEVDSLNRREPWAMVGVKGNTSVAVEQRLPYVDAQTTGTATAAVTLQSFFGSFRVTATSEWLGGNPKGTFTVDGNGNELVINLKDDVSSWRPGDHIVLASTDYDMEQAEEFELLPCEECSVRQVKINGQAKYTHFGEVADDVDLRGEVGLLTRNVKFLSEMEDGCYGDNFCQFFDYDTYGGHLKVLAGFKNVHLSGAEFTRMGRQVLGTYPVHFHLAGDVDEAGGYSRPTYVRDLSIHHCFSRCVTIHGTHGLLVQDTVGYDTLGHCYFLEDGNEQRNVLDHNLGLVTRPGTLLPSDRDENMCLRMTDAVYGDYMPVAKKECKGVSTFWISHPNNVLTNNSAAGSAEVGIWYIFHDTPTGPSEGSLPFKQAERTPLGRFYNNRVHSNPQRGLMIDDRVKTTPPSAKAPQEYLSLGQGQGYYPHQNADIEQPRVPAMIEGLIAYKNQAGAWIRGGDIWHDKCAFVDNGVGITMASSGFFPRDVGGTQQVWNSIFVGESANVGTDTGATAWGVGGVEAVERSFPGQTKFPMRGLDIYDGPTIAKSCTFKKYASAPEHDRYSSAIGWRLTNDWHMTPKNNVTDLKFENVKTRVFTTGEDVPFMSTDKDGDKNQIFHDLDGTVTGYPDTYVVRQDNHLVRNPGCLDKPGWRASICSGEFAQVLFSAQPPLSRTMTIVRDEYPDHPMTMGGATSLPTKFYQPVVALRQSYTIHWDKRAPEEVTIYILNFDSGEWVRLGLCYPPETTFQIKYQLQGRVKKRVTHEEDMSSVSTLTDVEDGSGKLFYFEESTGLLFLKLQANEVRSGDDYCSDVGCERIVITATMKGNQVSDCRASAYPRYRLTPTQTVPMPSFSGALSDCIDCGAQEPIVFDPNLRFLEVTVASAGLEETQQGHKSFVEINGVRYKHRSRGYLILGIDAVTGSVIDQATFDTHGSAENDLAMASFIRNTLPQNSVVVVTARTRASKFAEEGPAALKELGATGPVEIEDKGIVTSLLPDYCRRSNSMSAFARKYKLMII
ncbi:TMEM2 [Branchiostoma lanceolatum]|uniref:hyaluronoglucosaminidase n=1 Tax=Branchiostoma lanceolatum TaxID=7740 RepID=A0A8K0EGR2_BRALA|nr:TMEM2 [Branchiostoma lanceolatum]